MSMVADQLAMLAFLVYSLAWTWTKVGGCKVLLVALLYTKLVSTWHLNEILESGFPRF
jgi:hypothetical protein